jgi:hypothetical protein
MPGHRIIIRVLSKSGVSRVERSRNQCNATSTRITTAAIECITGGGLMMRKGERLCTSRTRICLASSARTASAYDVAVTEGPRDSLCQLGHLRQNLNAHEMHAL